MRMVKSFQGLVFVFGNYIHVAIFVEHGVNEVELRKNIFWVVLLQIVSCFVKLFESFHNFISRLFILLIKLLESINRFIEFLGRLFYGCGKCILSAMITVRTHTIQTGLLIIFHDLVGMLANLGISIHFKHILTNAKELAGANFLEE